MTGKNRLSAAAAVRVGPVGGGRRWWHDGREGDEYGRVAGGVSVERAQKGADRKNVSTSDPTEPSAATAAVVAPPLDPTEPVFSIRTHIRLFRTAIRVKCSPLARVYNTLFTPTHTSRRSFFFFVRPLYCARVLLKSSYRYLGVFTIKRLPTSVVYYVHILRTIAIGLFLRIRSVVSFSFHVCAFLVVFFLLLLRSFRAFRRLSFASVTVSPRPRPRVTRRLKLRLRHMDYDTVQ